MNTKWPGQYVYYRVVLKLEAARCHEARSSLHGCGGGSRTHDLRVMNSMSYHLLYSASYCERATLLSLQLHLAANHPPTFALLQQKSKSVCLRFISPLPRSTGNSWPVKAVFLSRFCLTSLSHVAALDSHKRSKEYVLAFFVIFLCCASQFQ